LITSLIRGRDMHVRDRAYGIETEYGCITKKNNVVLTPEDFGVDFLQRYIRRYEASGRGLLTANDRLWHPNASLTYIDTGFHPEHATAEARLLRDAVMYYKAGDRLMSDIFLAARDNKRVELFKNNVSGGSDNNIATFGCHENYLIYDYDATSAAIIKWQALIPFFVTRQIIDGTGYWDSAGMFFLSQRAFFMGSRRKNSPFSVGVKDAGPMARLHFTMGDSNIMEFASFMKLGTSSLMLSLVDANAMPELACSHEMAAFYDVAQSDIKDPVVWLKSGGRMSAYEIQALYCETARRQMKGASFESEQTEAELKEVVKLYEACLNALGRNDIAWMLGRLDWVTKQWLGRPHAFRNAHSSIKDIRDDLNILYHQIGPGALQERMNARWSDRRIMTDEEIVHAMACPPSGTRASSRAYFMRRMKILDNPFHVRVDWDHISMGKDLPQMWFPMPAPLACYDADIDRFINRVCAG